MRYQKVVAVAEPFLTSLLNMGVAMLSSVLNSKRAVQMNILIIRAFVKIRELLASSKDLVMRVEKLESSRQRHTSVIKLLADEIDKLKEPAPIPQKGRIGFRLNDDEEDPERDIISVYHARAEF